MGIPNRIYNLAKGQLDRAMERWEEIDIKAQQEIDEFIARHTDTNNMSAWDRAINKINSAAAEKELQPAGSHLDAASLQPEPNLDELQAKIDADRAAEAASPAPQTARISSAPPTQTLIAAYKMLGVQPGTDWLTVQTAYRKLRERAAPERFAAGSPEQATALDIQKRIDAAFMMVSQVLAPSGDRFGRLEL